MGIIKPRVKRRDPKTIEQLKDYLIEEWGAIPEEMVKNLCKGYLEKIKKILELNGGRIERKSRENQKNNLIYNWEKPMDVQKKRIVYNDRNLFIYKQREIKALKRRKKQIKEKYSKKMALIRDNIKKTKYRKSDLKNLSIGRGSSIVKENQKAIEEKINSEEEKNRLIKEIEEQIKKISKMNVFEYLRYKNGEIDEKSEDSLSTWPLGITLTNTVYNF